MTRTCFSCGTPGMVPGEMDLQRAVGDHTFHAYLSALVCTHCEETFVADKEVEAFELAVASELAKRVTDGPGFRFMRSALGLRAIDIAEILGVTPETVSRWETGKTSVDHRAFALVGALVLERVAGGDQLWRHLHELIRADRPETNVKLGRIAAP